MKCHHLKESLSLPTGLGNLGAQPLHEFNCDKAVLGFELTFLLALGHALVTQNVLDGSQGLKKGLLLDLLCLPCFGTVGPLAILPHHQGSVSLYDFCVMIKHQVIM